MFEQGYLIKIGSNFVGSPSFISNDVKESFENLQVYAKIFWILYPQAWNSTTGIAIVFMDRRPSTLEIL